MSVAGNTSNDEDMSDNADSEENSDVSSDSSTEDGEDDDSDDLSMEEIEIEVIDRAMQTEQTDNKTDNFNVRNNFAQTENDSFEAPAKVKLTSEKVKEIDSNLLDMVTDCLLPLNLVKQESFKIFCKSLETKYHMPKVKKLEGEIIKRYESERHLLEKKLHNTDSVVLTYDIWSTVDCQHYCTVTAYALTDKWKLLPAVLSTKAVTQEETKTITNFLQKIVTDWNLPSPVVVTGAGKQELSILSSVGFEGVACQGHFLRALVKDCLNHKTVISLIEKGRKFIRALQDLCTGDDLRKHQKADLSAVLEFHKLNLDIPELWNKTLDMLSSLTDQAETIRDVLKELEIHSTDIDHNLYSDEDIVTVKCLVSILSQFKTAAEILTEHEAVTAEKLLPTLIKLQKSVTEIVNDSAGVKHLKHEIRKQISSMILCNKEVLLLACIVHPQTKQMMFVSHEEMSHAKLLLLDKMTRTLRKEKSDKTGLKRTEDETGDGGSKSFVKSHSDESLNDKSLKSKEKSRELNESVKLTMSDDSNGKDALTDTESVYHTSNQDGTSIEMSSSIVGDSEVGVKTPVELEQTDIEDMDNDKPDITSKTDAKNKTYDTEISDKGDKMQSADKNMEVTDRVDEENNAETDNMANSDLIQKKITVQDTTSSESETKTKTEKDLNDATRDNTDTQKSSSETKEVHAATVTSNAGSDFSETTKMTDVFVEGNKVDSVKYEMPGKADVDIPKSKEVVKTDIKPQNDKTDWLEDVIGSGESQDITPELKAKIELDLYLAEPAVKTCALTWWKEKQAIFPSVSKVAKRLLAIPASSIGLEDVFNLTEDTVDVRKSQIDPKLTDYILFLNKNKSLPKDK